MIILFHKITSLITLIFKWVDSRGMGQVLDPSLSKSP